MLLISVYLDESGIHQGAEGTTMGGVLFLPGRWPEFERRWKEALKEWGLKHFHMADFESYQSPYEKWTKQEHEDRLRYLLDLIETYALGLVGLGLPAAVYEQLVPEDQRAKLTPYHLLALESFIEASKVTQWAGDEIRAMSPGTKLDDVRTAFIYEEVSKGSGPILAVYNILKRIPEIRDDLWQFVSLAYQPKEMFGALQAADILAYELYRDLPLAFGDTDQEPRYPMRRFLSTDRPIRIGGCTLDDMKPRIDGLRALLVDMPERGVRIGRKVVRG